jgi:hypothetical protein
MLVDKKIEKEINSALGDILQKFELDPTILRKGMPCYMKITHGRRTDTGYDFCLDQFALEAVKDDSGAELVPFQFQVRHAPGQSPTAADVRKFSVFMGLEFLGGVSLNRVVVTVAGVMSVDVNTIAARIDGVEMSSLDSCGDASNECFWTDMTADSGVRKGIIRGSFLTGGTVKLAEQDLGITDLKTIPEESNDRELHFSFKLGQSVPSQTKLHFTVNKTQPASAPGAGKPLESNTSEYPVVYSPLAPRIGSITLSGNKLTVKGNSFKAPLVVTLQSETGEEVVVPVAADPAPTQSQFDVAIPADLKPGRWHVQVQVGGVSSNESDEFVIKPK